MFTLLRASTRAQRHRHHLVNHRGDRDSGRRFARCARLSVRGPDVHGVPVPVEHGLPPAVVSGEWGRWMRVRVRRWAMHCCWWPCRILRRDTLPATTNNRRITLKHSCSDAHRNYGRRAVTAGRSDSAENNHLFVHRGGKKELTYFYTQSTSTRTLNRMMSSACTC